ncbi:hypothetical protein A0257_22225 [Hymenobacter psoromatis]|nr:hypothetical protein A0257_22225 [Hymenobacter psoromatis]
MLHALLANASDLDHWASLLEGKSTFPELLRRLIRATTPTLTSLSFPSAEGVQLEGWDGLTTANAATPYVPASPTGWELGTNKDQKGKADDDYATRTANPLELVPADSAFVFCTPRRWGQRKKWTTARLKEGHWRDVRAYDADDLITWLTEAPATHIWLSRLLHKQPDGVQDLENWWLDWANQTAPVMQPDWLVAGRTAAQTRLANWLADNDAAPKPYSVFASTADEARAFIAACIMKLSDEQRQYWLARTVVVTSELFWHQLVQSQQQLLLIPRFSSDQFGQLCAAATRQGHRVAVPRPSTEAKTTDEVVPPLGREALQEALQSAGIDKLDAAEKASLARRSFTAFHRTLLTDKSLQPPWWQEPASTLQLLPLALLGRWVDSEAGDQAVVASLTGRPYAEVQQQLAEWAARPNAPVRKIADEWFIIDPADVWEQTARFLSPALYQKFGDAIQQVLAQPLVRFSLPPHERRFAGLRSARDAYSRTLREGMVATLALVSSSLGIEAGNQPALVAWVNEQLRQLLDQAFAEPSGALLASLNHHLPLLAEAAPAIFLASLLRELKRPASVLPIIFQEEPGILHNVSHHTGLLWALESLVWAPQYLSDAAAVLAGLARLDPGGQLSNRPANSLRQIFLGWHPQTNASVAERLTVIDRLRHEEPAVAWSLLLRLLPQGSETSWPTHTPAFHWRDWQVNPSPEVSCDDYFEFIEGIAQRLLDEAGTDADRWASVISELPELLGKLHPDLRRRILAQIETLGALALPAEQQANLLGELRKFLHHHRSHPDTDWAWSEARLAPLQQLYDQLLPTDLLQRNAWVFDQSPQLPQGVVYRGSAHLVPIIREAQANALAELRAAHDLNFLPDFLPLVPQPYFVGDAIGRSPQISEAEKTGLLQRYLVSHDERESRFALGLASSYAWQLGAEAAGNFIRQQVGYWTPAQVASWLQVMSSTPATWQLAQEAGAEIEEQYWLVASDYVENKEDSATAARHLLRHGRPLAAAHILSHLHGDQPVPNELVLETLEFIAKHGHGADEGKHLRGYELSELLDELVNTPAQNRNRAITMAFIFSQQASSQRLPTVLDQALREDPGFFVEVLGYLYKPEADATTESATAGDEILPESEQENPMPDDTRIHFATLAFHILHDWKAIPGSQPDGIFNGDNLKQWAAEAKSIAAAKKLSRHFSSQLGKILSHAPAGPDGTWPHPAVCEMLQVERDNQELRDNFRTGCYNRHGRTHAVTGGLREQAIADEYATWASHYQIDYPAAASLLRELLDTFQRMAEDERLRAAREDQFGS